MAAGGISNQDYGELPEMIKERAVAFDRTPSVPRQLVSVRPGLDASLALEQRDKTNFVVPDNHLANPSFVDDLTSWTETIDGRSGSVC